MGFKNVLALCFNVQKYLVVKTEFFLDLNVCLFECLFYVRTSDFCSQFKVRQVMGEIFITNICIKVFYSGGNRTRALLNKSRINRSKKAHFEDANLRLINIKSKTYPKLLLCPKMCLLVHQSCVTTLLSFTSIFQVSKQTFFFCLPKGQGLNPQTIQCKFSTFFVTFKAL